MDLDLFKIVGRGGGGGGGGGVPGLMHFLNWRVRGLRSHLN